MERLVHQMRWRQNIGDSRQEISEDVYSNKMLIFIQIESRQLTPAHSQKRGRSSSTVDAKVVRGCKDYRFY